MAETNRDRAFPIGWLLGSAFGTWLLVALYVYVAVPILPTAEWGKAFIPFWYLALGLCIVLLCTMVVSLTRLVYLPQHRIARNIVAVITAPVVASFGMLAMVNVMAPLSGCC
jgi:hypothetical protein